MKEIVAVSRIYRGFVIIETMEGIFIPDLAKGETFKSWEEVQGFIDALYRCRHPNLDGRRSTSAIKTNAP